MNQPVELKVPLTHTQNLAATMAGEALVMMVDDEELVTELIQAYLDSAGYKRFISTTEPGMRWNSCCASGRRSCCSTSTCRA